MWSFFTQNLEAEKQLKFFQGGVAAAFAERDQSIMEVMTATLFSCNLVSACIVLNKCFVLVI